MNLSDVRVHAMSLAGVTEEPHHYRTSFRVGGKIFVTAIPDEPFINIMLSETAREPVLAMYPEFLEKLFWGKRVVGVSVDLAAADEAVVCELIEQAWAERAN